MQQQRQVVKKEQVTKKVVLLVDVDKCTGCYACQIACKDEHVDNDWSPYTKPQPEAGHFWMKIAEMERGSTPYVKVTYEPTLCMHCDNAPCIKVCPVGAISQRSDGIVLIDPEKCNGCRDYPKPLCMDACPYGVIYYNQELGIAQKCTLCAHLLDGKDPLWKSGVPKCVDACPTDALIFGDENDPSIKEYLAKAEVMKPEYETKPRVHYVGLPRPFMAGVVIDPAENRVIVGAKVVAQDLSTDEKYETTADELGDFFIRGLKPNHEYLVTVEKDGYRKRTVGVVTADKDRSLGEVKLYKGE